MLRHAGRLAHQIGSCPRPRPAWGGMVLAVLVVLGTVREGYAQRFTASGYVEDAETGERLVGASVVAIFRQRGTATNAHGFYSLTLPADTVTLRVSHLGYAPDTLFLRIDPALRQTVFLNAWPVALGEARVEAEGYEPVSIDGHRMAPGEIRDVPALLGERDVLKALQLLPGVQSGYEGSAGLHVRGGSPDQNLILLDGVPVYNADHLFGFVSVFNTDAIQSVDLVKGGFPSRYGGRLSSVVDITMKEGNLKAYGATGSLGLLASRLLVEGPIVKDRSSFVLSGRRTLLDLVARPFLRSETHHTGYAFFDLNARANYIFSDRSRFYVSLYSGRDGFFARSSETMAFSGETESSDADLAWGNLTATVRWTRLLGRRVFLSTTAYVSRYRLETAILTDTEAPDGAPIESFGLDYDSGVRDWSARVEIDAAPGPRHAMKAGLGGTHHTFLPGAGRRRARSAERLAQDTTFTPEGPTHSVDMFGYVEDEIRLNRASSIHVGVHGSAYMVYGAAYGSVQPRLAVRHRLPGGWRLQGSFATMRQYIHLLTNAGIGLPTDLWVPATRRVRPQDAWQAGVGAERTFPFFTLQVTGYVKGMRRLIAYKEGADFLATGQDWQAKIETGRGYAYGVEGLLHLRAGRATGWIAYTWSRSFRRFEGLNQGRTFPYRYDRPHDIAVVLGHRLTERRTVSVVWVYGTGQAVTLPVGRFLDGPLRPGDESFFFRESLHYGARNGVRMRAYHRLDVAYRIRYETRWGQGTLSLGVYNVYNRKNPFFMYYDRKDVIDHVTGTERTADVYRQVSLFPVLPSISYDFAF